MHRLFQRGFTLLEVVVAICIIGILYTIAAPRFTDFRDNLDVSAAANDAESLFAVARRVALTRSTRTSIDIDANRGILSVRVSGDTIQSRNVAELHGVTVWTSRNTVTYSPIGVGVGVSNLSLIFSKGVTADTLTVSRLGRVKRN